MSNMNYAIIENGIVVNMAVADAPLEVNWVLAPEGVAIGWTYDSMAFTPPAQPEPDPAAMIEAFCLAVDAHVEATAQSKGYNGSAHCASYVASTHAPWAAEAQAFVAWRDQVWLFVFTRLAQVEAGTAPPPSSPEELIAMLPQIEW